MGRFVEYRNSVEDALKFTKLPESFTSAWAEQIICNPDRFVQFEEATSIFNDKGFTQWALEALQIKKYFFYRFINSIVTGNINIDPTYDIILKNERILKNKVLQNV